MDKRTLMPVKKTVYKGYSHTCYIITGYKSIYLDIRLDIIIRTHVYMKMYYNIIGFLIICFQRNRCRNFIISFKIEQNTEKSINYNYFSDIY